MPEVPEETFFQALVELVKLDQGWVPSNAESALYIRPFMFASESHVGVRPSEKYRFCIFTCPVGAYYTKPVSVKVEQHFTRAARGGTGAAKAAGNYAGSLYPTELAKAAGYDQILWTDSATHTTVEECGTMNVAFVIDRVMVVPGTSDTVLAGVTRASAIALLRHAGMRGRAHRSRRGVGGSRLKRHVDRGFWFGNGCHSVSHTEVGPSKWRLGVAKACFMGGGE